MDSKCTIYKTMDFIGKRWTLLIILELYKRKTKRKRFSEIKRNLQGITPKILSLRLKELEKHNLIEKVIDKSKFPIKCEYSLTKKGFEFIPIVKDIKTWALKYKFKNKKCSETDCEECEF